MSNDNFTKQQLEKILDTFISSLDLNSGEYNDKALKKQLTRASNVYKPRNTGEGRKLSEYNIFVRETTKELKITEPTLTSRERMKRISVLWHEKKEKLQANMLN